MKNDGWYSHSFYQPIWETKWRYVEGTRTDLGTKSWTWESNKYYSICIFVHTCTKLQRRVCKGMYVRYNRCCRSWEKWSYCVGSKRRKERSYEVKLSRVDRDYQASITNENSEEVYKLSNFKNQWTSIHWTHIIFVSSSDILKSVWIQTTTACTWSNLAVERNNHLSEIKQVLGVSGCLSVGTFKINNIFIAPKELHNFAVRLKRVTSRQVVIVERLQVK